MVAREEGCRIDGMLRWQSNIPDVVKPAFKEPAVFLCYLAAVFMPIDPIE